MDKRNFLIGFAFIFTVLFILLGLAVYNRVEQRALAAVPVNQTATAERLAFLENLKFGVSPTPTITPTGTPRPIIPTFTASPTLTNSVGITATEAFSLTPAALTLTPGGTRTPGGPATPTPSITPGPSPTNTAKPTFTPTGSATPETITLTGRVLFNTAPVSGVALSLEDPGGAALATTTTAADGSYSFVRPGTPAVQVNVVFAQEDNPQYGEAEVMSFAWLGPVLLPTQGELILPDLEIATLGFGHQNPAPEAVVSAAAITAVTPLVFSWTVYPGAERYWVDLTEGEDQAGVWQTDFLTGTTVNFDGTQDDGDRIAPGEYGWAIGAQKTVGGYPLTVYGLLAALTVTP